MAGNEQVTSIVMKSVYSFSEAIEYIKRQDKKPTDISGKQRVRWFNVKTGNEVVIGCNY